MASFLCIAIHCIVGLFYQQQSMGLYSTFSLLSSIPPLPLNQYSHRALGTSILCESCLALFYLASDFVNQFAQPDPQVHLCRVVFSLSKASAWARVKKKEKKAHFQTFPKSHKFLMKRLLQLSVRASQQQRLEAEWSLGEGFHFPTGPDPPNSEAKWVKAKDVLTEASWTVPSSVPEALSVHNAFNSVILGPNPALVVGGWISPPIP